MKTEEFFIKKEGDVSGFVLTTFVVILTIVPTIAHVLGSGRGSGDMPMTLVAGLFILLAMYFLALYFLLIRPLVRLAVKAKYSFAKRRRIRAICRG